MLDDPGWLAVRCTPADVADVRNGRLAIAGDGRDLDDPRPWLLGRRQRHMSATVSVRVDASAGRGGIAARHDEQHWFALEASGDGGTTTVTARAALAGLEHTRAAELDGRYWSFEVAKSFTGRVIGLYAVHGMVTFADLRYSGTDAVPE